MTSMSMQIHHTQAQIQTIGKPNAALQVQIQHCKFKFNITIRNILQPIKIRKTTLVGSNLSVYFDTRIY